jgi:hypothetical protein
MFPDIHSNKHQNHHSQLETPTSPTITSQPFQGTKEPRDTNGTRPTKEFSGKQNITNISGPIISNNRHQSQHKERQKRRKNTKHHKMARLRHADETYMAPIVTLHN